MDLPAMTPEERRHGWKCVRDLVELGSGDRLNAGYVFGTVLNWMRPLVGPCATSRVVRHGVQFGEAAPEDRGPCVLWRDHGAECIGAWDWRGHYYQLPEDEQPTTQDKAYEELCGRLLQNAAGAAPASTHT